MRIRVAELSSLNKIAIRRCYEDTILLGYLYRNGLIIVVIRNAMNGFALMFFSYLILICSFICKCYISKALSISIIGIQLCNYKLIV